MTVWVNGAEISVEAGSLLSQYLSEHYPPLETTYVISNGQYISRKAYAQHTLSEGEHLMIYRIPSGG